MGSLSLDDLPERALLLVDSAPIIYVLEGHPQFSAVYRPVFEAHAAGRVRFAVTTVTLSEVLTGPLAAGNAVLAERYLATLKSWQVVPLDADIAQSTARLRAALKLKLRDAVQAASALAINASALVTHDRDFSRLDALRIIGIDTSA